MNSELIENKKKGGDSALVALDMAEIFSLVQAQEARRELTPPDLGLHKIGTRVAALTLSRLSAPPLALELLPLQERRLPAHWAASRSPLACGNSTAKRTKC